MECKKGSLEGSAETQQAKKERVSRKAKTRAYWKQVHKLRLEVVEHKRQVAQRTRIFCKWLRGAGTSDLGSLLRVKELSEGLYLYDHSRHDVFALASHLHAIDHPSKHIASIPWPIIWTLGRFNHKFRLCTRQMPDRDAVIRQMSLLENRIKWSWFYRASIREQAFLKIPYSTTPLYTKCEMVHPALRLWLSGLRRVVLSRHIAARSGYASQKSSSNCLPMFKWVKAYMRQVGLHICPNDKEPGITLFSPSDLLKVHDGMLGSESELRMPPGPFH